MFATGAAFIGTAIFGGITRYWHRKMDTEKFLYGPRWSATNILGTIVGLPGRLFWGPALMLEGWRARKGDSKALEEEINGVIEKIKNGEFSTQTKWKSKYDIEATFFKTHAVVISQFLGKPCLLCEVIIENGAFTTIDETMKTPKKPVTVCVPVYVGKAKKPKFFEWEKMSNGLYRMVKFPDYYSNRLEAKAEELLNKYDIVRCVANENELALLGGTIYVHAKDDEGFKLYDQTRERFGARIYVSVKFGEIFEETLKGAYTAGNCLLSEAID
jgi:hypothetical protein